jgi:hypothetical protein
MLSRATNNIAGGAKSSPCCVAAFFQDLDFPYVGLRPRKITAPYITKFVTIQHNGKQAGNAPGKGI